MVTASLHCSVLVDTEPGEGALVVNLDLTIVLFRQFIVTGVRNGGCRYFDPGYFPEVKMFL